MEDKEKKIVGYKDYVPHKVEDLAEFESVVLEDKEGTLFECRFRKPTTSELLKVKRENTFIRFIKVDKKEEEDEDLSQISGLEIEKIAQIVFDEFDCIPAGLKVNMLKPECISTLTDKFCSGV